VDFLFFPSVSQIYPAGFRSFITVEGLSDILCGSSRPGHFRGVATVVAKLFNIVHPDKAYFGQKDAQQAVIVKRMAADLNMPVKIRVLPTVREKDGLAMSSRNAYLNRQERQEALVLSRALKLARLLVKHGQRDASRVIRRMKELIGKKKSAKIDYVTVVDADTLAPLKKVYGKCLIALAVRVGKTRLIDNIIVTSNTSCHEKCEK
jgi:pantoate--beta-alanine ligase